ncbi:DUF58 domain-containing protein [Poseidonocella sedimentorum]|uniref:DUF58 domain-containing protein n=1 Tax=Poseidonocella sedimentorum TaxID=871652 RepID=A0A1I6EBQ3_9RHOB|nr:DUF58 domain-containing protein [Poseidonocella sedimentorum]SFR15179.1 Protein of unknown function DUF58 [Poseidonocella sedimentorum]
MSQPAALRSRAEATAAGVPALLAAAEHLAGTVLLGEHGRRRAGLGDDFWQYRPVRPGDETRLIDWRRSARGDETFLREREWQIAQSVTVWLDGAASMRFASSDKLTTKADRAQLLALAVSILLVRGGERVGLAGTGLPPRRGEAQVLRLAEAFLREGEADYGVPETRAMLPHARALFISDFMGDFAAVEAALHKAADRGVRGILLQILDPAEEAFPFTGRTLFQSVGGSLSHETLKARDLKARYLERLAERKDALEALARLTGWRYSAHHTGESAQAALLWLWHAFDGAR